MADDYPLNQVKCNARTARDTNVTLESRRNQQGASCHRNNGMKRNSKSARDSKVTINWKRSQWENQWKTIIKAHERLS